MDMWMTWTMSEWFVHNILRHRMLLLEKFRRYGIDKCGHAVTNIFAF